MGAIKQPEEGRAAEAEKDEWVVMLSCSTRVIKNLSLLSSAPNSGDFKRSEGKNGNRTFKEDHISQSANHRPTTAHSGLKL